MAALPKFLIQTLVLFYILSTSQSTTNFTYHGFNNTNILTRRHKAAVEPNGALRLTATSRDVIGHAFHPYLIPFKPDAINNASSFSTHFVFRIVPAESKSRGGFGLAFTLSPSTSSFDGAAAGHFLGVFNESNDGSPSNHVFMVEFDTVNGYNQTTDSDGNHVGININGMKNAVASIPAARYVDGARVKTEEVYLESDTVLAQDAFEKKENEKMDGPAQKLKSKEQSASGPATSRPKRNRKAPDKMKDYVSY